MISTFLGWAWWKKWLKQYPALEGIPIVGDQHWLLGHIPHLASQDFEEGLKKIAVEHADQDGLSCFYIRNLPALCITRG
eukprot:10452357-Ditylum_brightwellii.AAC.1